MRRVIGITLALALGLVLPTAAAQPKIGEVVGHTYATDVTAQINGHTLRSYNIGGTTAVVAEDLKDYGFTVVWNEAERSLTVERNLEGQITGDYQPQGPAQPLGAVSGDIYATDIKTYVQGERVESFALHGETAIALSQLERTGTLVWNGESRTAEFTLAEDPMEFVLEREEAQLNNSGLSCWFERYPGPGGTLAVYGQNGTPHGSACRMLYVAKNGRQIQIDELLPDYGFGTQYYLEPRDITFDETGTYLTFITPVKSEENGETKDWGDTKCTVSTAGSLISMVSLRQPLEQWDVYCPGVSSAMDAQKPTEITVTRETDAYEASIQSAHFAYSEIGVSVSNESVLISGRSYGTGAQDEESTYQKAVSALRSLKIPDVMDENFVQANTDSQRQQASQYFRVTKNGQPISGVLWWSRGNGHVDLNFTFDQNVSLDVGDVVEVWIGVPEEN